MARGAMRATEALPRRTRRQCKEVGDRASGSLRATGPMSWSRQWPAPSTVPQQGVPLRWADGPAFTGGWLYLKRELRTPRTTGDHRRRAPLTDV